MSKDNPVAPFPPFEKITEKDLQAVVAYVHNAVDERMHQHLLNLPQTMAAMGVKLSRKATFKETATRFGLGVGLVAASVSIGVIVQKYRERGRRLEMVEEKEQPAHNRVRPVGTRQITAQA